MVAGAAVIFVATHVRMPRCHHLKTLVRWTPPDMIHEPASRDYVLNCGITVRTPRQIWRLPAVSAAIVSAMRLARVSGRLAPSIHLTKPFR
jgi:hypothetical protein